MKYPELIDRVQNYSGYTRGESEDALQVMVESLSVHLPEPERKDFASQLPSKLKDIALTVYATPFNSKEEILIQVMKLQKIDQPRAKKQIKIVWRVLKEAVSQGQIKHIRSQLPRNTLTYLN